MMHINTLVTTAVTVQHRLGGSSTHWVILMEQMQCMVAKFAGSFSRSSELTCERSKRKTAALKTTHTNVSCSCRGLPKRGEREGVEEHRAAWPCNEAHRTAPGYFEGAGSRNLRSAPRDSAGPGGVVGGGDLRPLCVWVGRQLLSRAAS